MTIEYVGLIAVDTAHLYVFMDDVIVVCKIPALSECNPDEADQKASDIGVELAKRLCDRFRMRTDLVKSLSGEAKCILLNRLFADSVEVPSWVKILAKPKLYLGGILSQRQVVAESLNSAMSRDLAKAGYSAIGSYHLFAYLSSAVFYEAFFKDVQTLWLFRNACPMTSC